MEAYQGDVCVQTADNGADYAVTAKLVARLLDELSPEGTPAVDVPTIERTAADLLGEGTAVWALLARNGDGNAIGVLTLNACAAIYAGGTFGEISELYVLPEYRSSQAGKRLLEAARDFARGKQWTRLEVGAPDQPRWARTVKFYKHNGFDEVGPRLRLRL